MLTIATAAANLDALFAAKAVARGRVVPRSAACADEHIGQERLTAEVRRQDFHMIRRGGQYVVTWNPGFLEVVR
ncbi:N-(5'-phosphoribosyl)anthranilate isomerase [Palleronia abyssalis]|uniref:Uncharacterized protein n=1 Tax=Palleronia abyssalis TaxID=1501240 RepID=A0A2R8BU76_9RHOB|nr:N-(5'-phosphoribosyl)anthranilate isomerase [Palleronia abyssalis]SPJ23683.1 hypothetical protein PAA8504_01497 [Palleronia abyssalis]